MVPEAIGGTLEAALELITSAGDMAEGDGVRVIGLHPLEELPVGSERLGQDERIAAVVFGAGGEVAVAESVQLPGVDRIDGEALKQ